MNPILMRYAGVVLAAAIGVGVGSFTLDSGIFWNKAVQNKKVAPFIESMTPQSGAAETEITIVGSGFSTEAEGLGPNNVKVKRATYATPLYSPDGKTIKFNLYDIGFGGEPWAEFSPKCEKSQPWPEALPNIRVCMVPIQIINGHGLISNVELYILSKRSSIESGF